MTFNLSYQLSLDHHYEGHYSESIKNRMLDESQLFIKSSIVLPPYVREKCLSVYFQGEEGGYSRGFQCGQVRAYQVRDLHGLRKFSFQVFLVLYYHQGWRVLDVLS